MMCRCWSRVDFWSFLKLLSGDGDALQLSGSYAAYGSANEVHVNLYLAPCSLPALQAVAVAVL